MHIPAARNEGPYEAEETTGPTVGTVVSVRDGEGVEATGDDRMPPIGGVGARNSSGEAQARRSGGLTDEDVALLAACEETIRGLGKAAAAAGEAFATIKARKLHRHYGVTWAEYTRGQWGLSVSRVDRLIQAAPVMRELAIHHEGTARELVQVYRDWGPQAARAIWTGAQEGAGGRGTAKVARAAVLGVLDGGQDARSLPPDTLEIMARKAVAQADQMQAKKMRPTAAKSADDGVIDAEIVEDGPGEEWDDDPAWMMPEQAVRYFSEWFLQRAGATGATPERVMWDSFAQLRATARGATPGSG